MEQLTKKQQDFVDAYFKANFNATDAYLKLHPRCKRTSAAVCGCRINKNSRIRAAINDIMNNMYEEDMVKLKG